MLPSAMIGASLASESSSRSSSTRRNRAQRCSSMPSPSLAACSRRGSSTTCNARTSESLDRGSRAPRTSGGSAAPSERRRRRRTPPARAGRTRRRDGAAPRRGAPSGTASARRAAEDRTPSRRRPACRPRAPPARRAGRRDRCQILGQLGIEHPHVHDRRVRPQDRGQQRDEQPLVASSAKSSLKTTSSFGSRSFTAGVCASCRELHAVPDGERPSARRRSVDSLGIALRRCFVTSLGSTIPTSYGLADDRDDRDNERKEHEPAGHEEP